jgi:hypothetical protein
MTDYERPTSRAYEPLPDPQDIYFYRSALGEISLADQELFNRMDAAAGLTWSHMNDGWRRLRRPNAGVDTSALQCAVFLEGYCSEALNKPTLFLHPNTNLLRQKLYAGALTVQHLLPVPIEERATLRGTMAEWHRGQETWRTDPPERHTRLIDHWRQWLRSDGIKRAAPGSELHGGASIFAAAAYEIRRALNPSLYLHYDQPDSIADLVRFDPERDPRTHQTFDPGEKLVYPVVGREPWRYRQLRTD